MSLAPALNYLMLVCAWALSKKGVQNPIWEVVHQAGGLTVKVFRDWILHTPGTKIEIAPGNRFLLEELLKTVHTPYGGTLLIFYDKVSSMFNLMQSYLGTESNHGEIFLPVFVALLLSVGYSTCTMLCIWEPLYYLRFLL